MLAAEVLHLCVLQYEYIHMHSCTSASHMLYCTKTTMSTPVVVRYVHSHTNKLVCAAVLVHPCALLW